MEDTPHDTETLKAGDPELTLRLASWQSACASVRVTGKQLYGRAFDHEKALYYYIVEGKCSACIARHYKVTRQAVGQILKKAGLTGLGGRRINVASHEHLA